MNLKKLLGKALRYVAPIIVTYAAEAATKEVQKRTAPGRAARKADREARRAARSE